MTGLVERFESAPLVWQVFWAALATALATGLGAIPFAFMRKLSLRWQGILAATAGGMMISASVFALAEQALRRGEAWEVAAGMLVGAAFFAWTARLVGDQEIRIAGLATEESRKAVLIIVIRQRGYPARCIRRRVQP